MTTETAPPPRAASTTPPSTAIGLNWYDADPNLQQLVERMALPEDRAFAEQHLRNMGGVIGGPVAARAEVTDKHPPSLEKYDASGNEINDIVHHPGALARNAICGRTASSACAGRRRCDARAPATCRPSSTAASRTS